MHPRRILACELRVRRKLLVLTEHLFPLPAPSRPSKLAVVIAETVVDPLLTFVIDAPERRRRVLSVGTNENLATVSALASVQSQTTRV